MKTHAEAKRRIPSRAHALLAPNALAHHGQLRQALRRAGVQPRLDIGGVDEPLEREAERVAEHMAAPLEGAPSQLPADGERLQPKASAAAATTASPQLESALNSLKQGGTPLDTPTRAFFEPRFGQNFSQVRLHTDNAAAQMAEALNAQAFTLGNDIAFAASHTPAEKNLLGHELAHVVQQNGVQQNGVQQNGVQQRGLCAHRLQAKWVQRKPEKQGFLSEVWGNISELGGNISEFGSEVWGEIEANVGAAVDVVLDVAMAVGEVAVVMVDAAGDVVVAVTKGEKVGDAAEAAGKKVGTKVLKVGSPIIYRGMEALSAIQTHFGLESEGRRLSADEEQMLLSIYGGSIDYTKVVIKEGKVGIIKRFNPNRSFVIGNIIYSPSGKMSNSTLVHEMMHVWQYQNKGVGYIGNALAAQAFGPTDPKGGSRGYYYDADVVAEVPFEKLNAEQQAQLIQHAVAKGVVPPICPQKTFIIKVDGRSVDRTDYVLKAWDSVVSP